MLKILNRTLNSIGQATKLLKGPDGTTLLILPHGGRILGLFSPDKDENYLWTNPALLDPELARSLYCSDQWQNSGGDRTWLSPEVEFFFPSYPDLDRYKPPPELDPGSYRVTKNGIGLQLVSRLKLKHARSQRTIALEITKRISPIPNPLRHENVWRDLSHVAYAGYRQHTSLQLLSLIEDGQIKVGLWDLLQMPHGGELVVATYGKTVPRIYFGQISKEDLIVDDQLVRYHMRAKGEHKLGIRAIATTGRVAYLYQAGDQWSLVTRNFFVTPSGDYIDVPKDNFEDVGYSIQACNVNSHLGSFSELEHHAPAIGKGTGRDHGDDTADTWAYRGSLEEIRAVAGCLISSDLIR